MLHTLLSEDLLQKASSDFATEPLKDRLVALTTRAGDALLVTSGYDPGRNGTMIISDKHSFVFLHIPKCAGSTVRNALAPYDDHAKRFFEKAVATHPVLGSLDHAHIPLAVLQHHFPEDFEKLKSYRSFALVRDPYLRFPSSLHERFVQRDRQPLSSRAKMEVAREVDQVLACLANLPKKTPITDPGLIHFSRQSDYIFLKGYKLVESVRMVAEVDDLLAEMSNIVGQPVRPEESKNRRLSYTNKTVERLQIAITQPIERLLPRWIWKPAYMPIKSAFISLGLISESALSLATLPNSREIQSFIEEFYVEDIALFTELQALRATSTEPEAH